jgi:pilus assembly protein CpaF
MDVIERLLAPLGRHVSDSSPMVDARLMNGAAVNIVIPPLALRGPALTVRKPKQQTMNIDQLVAFGTLTRSMADFLDMCVAARKNVVISGMYGSGRTTLLNCLAARIPEGERIITIEDAAELQLPQAHCVALAARAPDSIGAGGITIRDLVHNSLRMNPNRIVLGECLGNETLDIVQAMNAGHNFLFTLHANSPIDCLAKLESMVLTSGVNLPLRAVREQIASAVNVIVQISLFVDGSHKISLISEISGMEADVINMQDIFYYKQDPVDDTNEVKGTFITTGIIPKFYEDLKQRGISADLEIFRE